MPPPTGDEAKLARAPILVIAFTLPHGATEDLVGHGRARRDLLGESPPALWVDRQILMALTTIKLVAEAYGVATAPMQSFDPQVVKAQSGLPPEADIIALLALGFTDESAEPARPAAPPLGEIVHVERYGRPWQAESD